jgi:glycosyltransferase 2 family protein
MIETRNKSRARMTLKIIGTTVALALVVYLLWRQGWDQISAVVSQISFGMFALTFVMTLMSRTAVGWRWHVLLRSAGVKISAFRSISLTFAGLFASNFLPTTIGGDVVRLAGVLRSNLDRPVCVASLIVDRLVGMAGMALAIPFILPGLPGGFFLTTAAPFLAGAPVLGELDVPAGSKTRKLLEKSLKLLKRLLEALSFWIKHPQSLFISLLMSLTHMLLLFGTLWLLLRAMGEPTSFWLIAGMWSLTYFVTLLPISINGLGVQELSMTFLFTQVGGISEPTALTLAFLIRILQMFASLPGAFYLPNVVVGEESLPA